MENLLQDLRYGMRALGRQPGFSLVAILTLALGIGANTAIFSVVNAALLRPFSFQEPERLMKVSLVGPPRRGAPPTAPPDDDVVWSYPKFQTFRQLQQIFERVATYRGATFNLTGADEAERIAGEIVGADYFPVLGIGARVGRTFLAEEDATPATHWVALLGHGLWQRRFGGDPTLVGKTITLDTRPYTVVGVLPEGFRGLTALAEVWVPTMTLGANNLGQRWAHSHEVIARLSPGVSVAAAKSAVEVLGKQIYEAHPNPGQTGPSAPWGARARATASSPSAPCGSIPRRFYSRPPRRLPPESCSGWSRRLPPRARTSPTRSRAGACRRPGGAPFAPSPDAASWSSPRSRSRSCSWSVPG